MADMEALKELELAAVAELRHMRDLDLLAQLRAHEAFKVVVDLVRLAQITTEQPRAGADPQKYVVAADGIRLLLRLLDPEASS